MADTQEFTQQVENQEQAEASKTITGVGRKQPFAFNTSENDEIIIRSEAPATTTTSEAIVDSPATEEKKIELVPTVTSEQVKEYLKSLNIGFDGDIETIKERLKPRTAEPSEEEKLAAERAEEKSLLDLFVENGGNIDQFSAWKSIKAMGDSELAKSAALRELMELGLSREEADEEIAHRYRLNELDSIEQGEDEDDEAFEERKSKIQKRVEIGAKKLANKSAYIKQQADQFFNGLKDGVKAREEQKHNEEQYSSKIEEYFTKMPREITFELGERDGQKLDPIKFKVSNASITESKETLKDTAKRNQFFFNQDGTLNIENATKLLVAYNNQNEMSRVSFLEGETRNTQHFESIYPSRTAYQLGVGGTAAKNGGKGQVTGKGIPQKVRSQQFQK